MSVPPDEPSPSASLETPDDANLTPELIEVRSLLLGPMTSELEQLRARVAELEALVIEQGNRAEMVSEVLVDSVADDGVSAHDLGHALSPAVEQAVTISARTDSTVLAEALYPVMGPAMRRMIANMFSPEALIGGGAFSVQQVLLIERESGVLLADAAAADVANEDADIVSGMLDAIRLFVNEAFDTPEHDGLQDLRVGDTTVMVEWGPKAVLASVVHGVPSEQYREQAALTLEAIHRDFAPQLDGFDGRIELFAPVQGRLRGLHETSVNLVRAEKNRARVGVALRIAAVIAVIALIIALIVWLV